MSFRHSMTITCCCFCVLFLPCGAFAEAIDPNKLIDMTRQGIEAGRLKQPLVTLDALLKRLQDLRVAQFRTALAVQPPKGWKLESESRPHYANSIRTELEFRGAKESTITITYEEFSPGKQVEETTWELTDSNLLKRHEKQQVTIGGHPWVLKDNSARGYVDAYLTTVLPEPNRQMIHNGLHIVEIVGWHTNVEQLKKFASLI